MTRLAMDSLVGLSLAVVLTGCSDQGDLHISNDGPGQVTVMTGDEKLVVDANGGAVLLNYGCTPGDVTVEFAADPPVVLPGPVCPRQRIMVGDGTAELQPAVADR